MTLSDVFLLRTQALDRLLSPIIEKTILLCTTTSITSAILHFLGSGAKLPSPMELKLYCTCVYTMADFFSSTRRLNKIVRSLWPSNRLESLQAILNLTKNNKQTSLSIP